MERYLDPKADLTFKKVFGEHPDLARSFLNALLPLEAGEEIESIEYLPAELVPENPLRKNSIVDVCCRDNQGRQFLVEMQMVWSPEFEQRVSFDADKAYVRQLGKGGDYRLPEPVYSLNLLVNNVIDPALPGYYHSYRMVHEACSERVIEGLRLVFVELPKFTPHTFSEKRMHVLWLRYLTEIGDQTVSVSSDLRNDPEVGKALSEIRASAFTDAELAAYDKFWDQVSVEVTLYNSGERKGRAEGRAEGERQKALEIARKLKGVGQTIAEIASLTGLSLEEVERL
ncbi:MAG TPA: Rpn family recombination-promoting nuclease/putative transposase [Candidatus Parabacteroides intestinipullorum]|uniref:Rpn family recombination-promoting nuclease/putative transposase n=1 Tax=Candidatus Parabacteroides intestinipullorum TaxID=2838723 RepID=A0A9D1X9N0_9BACT|nr:Rpn family recombination-promoting nuclease/putative transposase [Candidatus Parabacteroides intestinipullorum]